MLALAVSTGAAQSRPIDEKTAQALEKLGKANHFETRSLLTPPFGSIPQDVQRARQQITDIFVELGGSDLKAYEGHWIVNIYADSQEKGNAWVKQLFHEERIWNEAAGRSIRYRDAMKLASDGMPIYEFGFSVGLLSRLQTKDQLAFIIGHELTHLLERHLDSESGRVSSQQHEVVADAESTKRLIGKYNIKAGIEAMSMFHEVPGAEVKPGNTMDLLVSGAASHHHEGQRISALQFLVEHYLRTDPRAQDLRTSTPLSDFFRIQSRMPRIKPDANFSEWVKYYRETLNEVFLNNEKLAETQQDGRGHSGFERSSMVRTPSPEQRIEFLNQLIADIESAPVSKSVKVNAFLQIMSFIEAGQFQLGSLSGAQVQNVTRFLLKNSVGSDGWRYSDYALIEQEMKPEFRLYLNQLLLGNKGGLSVLTHLVKLSPEWKRLYEGLHDIRRFKSLNGEIDVISLEKEVLRSEKSKDILVDQHIRSLAEELKSARWKDGKIPDFYYLRSLSQKAEDKSLRTQGILDVLKVNEYSVTVDYVALRQDILESIKASEVSFDKEYTFSNAKVLVASRILNDTSVSLIARKAVFYRMAIFLDDNMEFKTGSEVSRNLSQFLNSLSKEAKMQLLLNPYPVIAQRKEKVFSLARVHKWQGLIQMGDVLDKAEKEGSSKYVDLLRSWGRQSVGVIRLFSYGNQSSFVDKMSAAENRSFFESLERHSRTYDALLDLSKSSKAGRGTSHRDASAMLVMALSSGFSELSFGEFQKRWTTIREMAGEGYSLSPEMRLQFEKYTQSQFPGLKHEAQIKAALDPHLSPLLNSSQIAEVLVEDVRRKVGADHSVAHLSALVLEVIKTAKLKEKPQLYNRFRNSIAEKWNLQPNTVARVFPQDGRTATQKTSSLQEPIRGLSALLAATRGHAASEQLQMIDYLMGRAGKWPAFIDKMESDIQGIGNNRKVGVSLISHVVELKKTMQLRSEVERAALVNSFLTGPTGLIKDKQNLAVVSERILAAVTAENRDFARIMLDSLYQAEGMSKSVFLSYVLAQKSTSSSLSEALVLKSILDAYGVPGVKLAQYLSFTDEFRSFKSTLETYQDAALPLSYYEMLELIQDRLGDKWNAEKFRIVKILGSGSVNIAVEYVDLETGKSGVINVSRSNIVTKTSEDFYRFELLLKSLSGNPTHGRKFDFVVGLMNIIKSSVSLEFDKKHAFEIQRELQALYNRDVKGWKVRTVDAYSVEGMTIMMQKAPGVGARQLSVTDPQAYRSAMAALLSVEDSILRGVGADDASKPKALHANPDLHDGQVLIDVKEKIVTLLDFGQAERISNSERQLGIEMLRFISGVDSAKSAKSNLESRLKSMGIKNGDSLTVEFFSDVLSRTDRMDRFVRLVSGLSQRGVQVPLSSVHWVLAVNRAIKLGHKIDVPMEAAYRNMLLTTKVGLSLQTYNKAASLVRPLPAANKAPALSCSKVFAN